MTVALLTTIKNFIGLSTDSKPTGVQPGSTFWAYNTNILYKTYDGTNWVPVEVKDITLASAETQDWQQAVNDYDLFTATGGSVFVQNFTLTNTTNHSGDAGAFTGMSVASNSVTPVTLVSQANGVKAQLTAAKVFTYSTPFSLLVGEKIRYHVYGGPSTLAGPFTVTCRYQPINPAGYLA